MKRFFLIFLSIFLISGCTSIFNSKDKSENKKQSNISKAEKINVIGNSLSVFTNIKLTDRPIGWANADGSPENYGGYNADSTEIKIFENVDNYDKLKTALTDVSEKRIIYITGSIDLNNNKSPYDYIIQCEYENDYSSYEDYKEKFGATCVKDSKSSLHDVQQKLFKAQRKQVSLSIPSNTTIIGKTENAAILNGEFLINGKENVVIRNIKFWNAEDYFPLWYQSGENNFNSVYDNITIDNSKWIWIDHCTIGEDSYVYDKVQTPVGELDWVTYDGAVDIGRASKYVTISWCHFVNHDKTLLIGYGQNIVSDENNLQVTIHHNYFENCRSRLPLVRHGTVHVYNNIYFCQDKNKSGFCIGIGHKSRIYAEKNIIKNCKYGFNIEKWQNENYIPGKIFFTDNIDESTYWNEERRAISETIDWNPKNDYNYVLDELEVIQNIEIN